MSLHMGMALSRGGAAGLAVVRTRDHHHPGLPVNACLVQIGREVIPVYGNQACGWRVEGGDLHSCPPRRFRYRSLEELFSALVTMAVGDEGRA
jgi:methenyltetrahydromethanopterin cyclohydrolase